MFATEFILSSSILILFGVSRNSSDSDNRLNPINCRFGVLFCDCSFSFHPFVHFSRYFVSVLEGLRQGLPRAVSKDRDPQVV